MLSNSRNSPAAHGRWLRPVLIAALLIAFALRLTELGRQNIWWDEARNIDVSLRALVDIAPSFELDIQPPLYFWLLHGWLGVLDIARGVDPQLLAWAARWLSVAAGVTGVALVAILARRVGHELAAGAAALIAAISPFWLAESQEARTYTLTLALLAAAAWCLLAGLEPGRPQASRVWRLALFTVLSAAALITHYNVVFVLVAWYLWWGVLALLRPGRWRNLLAPLLAGLGTVLVFAPIAPIALRQIPTYANPNLTVPTVAAYLGQNAAGHLGGYPFDASALNGYANTWLSLSLALAAGGLVALAIRHQRARVADGTSVLSTFGSDLAFLLTWLAGGLALYYIAVVDRGAFNIRYSSMVTPALFALVGAGLAGWGRWIAVPALALVLAGMLPLARADLYDPRFAREDIAGVTRWLRENAREGDVVLVDQKYPFGFYYHRYTTRPDEDPAGPEIAPARYLFVDAADLDQNLKHWAGDAARVFWVQWFESDTDPRHLVPFLLEQRGRHEGEQWFQGWSVDWWTLQPPNDFALAPNLQPQAHTFAGAVQTVEASLPTTGTPDAAVPIAIRWRRLPEGAIDLPLKARVALYDAGGGRVAQADERLLSDRHLSPSQWSAEETPLNVYLVQSEMPLAPGEYEIRLLVYDADTLEPLSVLDDAGAAQGVEVTLGSIHIE